MAKPDIVATVNTFNTWTPQELVQAYHGRTGAVAAELAGTSDRKSPAFKAAMRNVQRYLKGQRTPSAATQEKLNAMGRSQEKGKDIGMTMDGNICVNGQGPNYCRDRTIDRTFSPEEWDELTALAEEGDEEGIWDYIASSYGVNYLEVMDGEITIGEE